MRILHSIASLDPSSGGPARSVPQLALALAQRGVEVGLWSPQPVAGPLADFPADESSQLQIFSGDFTEALDAFGSPDLVHDHGIWLPCHREVAKACKARNISRIVSPRGMLEPWALNHKKWKKRIAWWLYQKRDLQLAVALHATAEQEATQLKHLGLTSPVLVAANGVTCPDADAYNLSQSNTKTALFVSRVHPKKGLPMLIEAWAKVQPEGWQMRVVGPDEDGHLEELKSQVNKAGLSDRWSFEDSLEGDAKWQAMAEADLFILPSHSENFGIVVAEALASGTPVITTTGTPWQGLSDHDCGWWVEPNISELTTALKSAITLDDDQRHSMGQRGRTWVAEEFAWPAIAAKAKKFYQEVLE